MRKISDTHYTEISDEEKSIDAFVGYVLENGIATDLDSALAFVIHVGASVKVATRDDTFRTYLEDEYVGGDAFLQRFPENETCSGYPEEPRRGWFYRLVRIDQRFRHWREGLFALDPYDGKTGLRIEDEEWRD